MKRFPPTPKKYKILSEFKHGKMYVRLCTNGKPELGTKMIFFYWDGESIMWNYFIEKLLI